MVPGVVDGWDRLLRRFGTMKFKEVLEPARRYAFEGFPVHEVLAGSFRSNRGRLCGLDPPRDKDTASVYCPGGDVPGLYGVFRNPDLGRAFETLQEKGVDAFYRARSPGRSWPRRNPRAGAMDHGRPEKLRIEVEPPLSTNYHGYDIYETPPRARGGPRWRC
jgi:gamma-glutamyltranspeptidase/glutathione hydrolase